LLTVFFTGGVGLLAVYLSTGFTPKPAPVLTTLTLIFIGLALIFAMSRVYMLRTVPTWNNLATPVSFYLTAFLAGSLVAVFIILHNEMDSLFILLNFSLVILIIQLLAVVFIRKAMWTGESVIRNYRFLFGLRSGLLGITVLALSLLRIINNPGFDLVTAVLLASILMVSASEIIGRFLFYMSYRRIGV